MSARRRSTARRRPSVRRVASRPRKKKQRHPAAVLIPVALALWMVGRLLDWVAAHPWVVVVALALAVTGGVLWYRHRAAQFFRERESARALRYPVEQLDLLHHRAFEHAVRDLMFRDGCTDAVQVGGAGDHGADVKATDPYGRRWVIQCKHRKAGSAGAAVGTPDLHVLNGTGRPVHRGDVVVLVTNGRFSGPALEFARSQRLHLVDRATLTAWAGGGRPLWELLRAVPPPRGPGPLS
ncbi:restriction endonuclease [Streptomyces sp. MBT58]|uniref:restriction endonuclease n=1 Tax=Streptomyces sp. MBT58 TaxID=1488389 RepID=UPI00191409BF|nr:restriction endonuclease [Streptomyces sp. MBT58]MBK5996169.1 restriction endonuclease [Streptomyces sp. MBT58]